MSPTMRLITLRSENRVAGGGCDGGDGYGPCRYHVRRHRDWSLHELRLLGVSTASTGTLWIGRRNAACLTLTNKLEATTAGCKPRTPS